MCCTTLYIWAIGDRRWVFFHSSVFYGRFRGGRLANISTISVIIIFENKQLGNQRFLFRCSFCLVGSFVCFFFVFVQNRKTFGRMPNCNWNRRHAIIAVNGTMRRPISYRHLWMADSDNGWWQRYVTLVSGARWFENSIRKCMKLSRKTWHGQYCSVSMIVVKHLVLSYSPFFLFCVMWWFMLELKNYFYMSA